jgi:nucleoside-diphosphate-sugar epimerase
MKKVAIFGGTGFIGRELARALAERGDEAVIVPREPARGVAAGSFRRLTWRDLEDDPALLEGCEAIKFPTIEEAVGDLLRKR